MNNNAMNEADSATSVIIINCQRKRSLNSNMDDCQITMIVGWNTRTINENNNVGIEMNHSQPYITSPKKRATKRTTTARMTTVDV
jgi:hypothetical protein